MSAFAAPFSIRPLEELLRQVQAYGLNGAPVLRLNHPAESAKRLVSQLRTGATVGLRVPADQVNSMIGTARIAKSLETWGLSPERVHLFVDQGLVASPDPPTSLMLGIPFPRLWRMVTLLGGSFPKDLRGLEPDVHLLPRLEWMRFKSLLGEWPSGLASPGFGDYGTLHPHFKEPKDGCRPSASVRYALEDVWLVIRGYAIANKQAGGMEQFRGHALFLADHPDFSGRRFSFGDSYIADRGRPGATTGNLTTWLAASMNHHITRTCCSLAALSADRVAAVDDAPRALRVSAVAAPNPEPPRPNPAT